MKLFTFLTVLLSIGHYATAKEAKAIFSGGCFWCMEAPFEKLDGVISAESGYTGGTLKNPKYKQVASGKTRHIESVLIKFDDSKISYETLLQVFWRQVDPTDGKGQFVDRGYQYTTAIFYTNDNQKKIAELSKKQMQDSGRYKKKIVTPISPAKEFFLAEGYHQDYYKTNTVKYKYYRFRSGRDQYITKIWGEDKKFKTGRKIAKIRGNMNPFDPKTYKKPSKKELKKMLDSEEYKITQKDGTEKPFENRFWNKKEEGIYVDVVSNEPLFSSTDKFKSGTGWPSFSKPLVSDNLVEKKDFSLFSVRTEVRSKYADSHLGHVFSDGPGATGLRYCMNSASLRFVPVKQLDDFGLGRFKKLFEKSMENKKQKQK